MGRERERERESQWSKVGNDCKWQLRLTVKWNKDWDST